jgi:pimeloyl-ACP methyl ester carboxylesterase
VTPSRFRWLLAASTALVLAGPLSSISLAQNASQLGPPKLDVPYGKNRSAGRFEELNGIKLYFERYGNGQPVLQIHGNGETIASMGYQIKFFARKYTVIAADSRGHGQSGPGAGRLTYEQIADDLNVLLDRLGLKSVYVLGWSDGGIVGLLLAIHHPDKVGKLAIMGANLDPKGAYDWAFELANGKLKEIDAMIAKGDTSQPWARLKQYFDLLATQPNIPLESLKRVTAPTLVMAGDKDVIRDEHTLDIFHQLPKAHLAIFPGATHMIPWQDPELFNRTVDTFFAKPFARPDTKELLQQLVK